jgi:hypothetical protein
MPLFTGCQNFSHVGNSSDSFSGYQKQDKDALPRRHKILTQLKKKTAWLLFLCKIQSIDLCKNNNPF